MSYDLTYLSFGGGTQSTALLILSALGIRGCPKADVAIFADTGDEPEWVLPHVRMMADWSAVRGIEVRIVSAGHLSKDVADYHAGKKKRFAAIPAWTKPHGAKKSSPLMRQCTRDYKISPIKKEVRRLLGLKHGQRAAGKFRACALIGISYDEFGRRSDSRESWIDNEYPLCDAEISTKECRQIIEANGLSVPKKSACVFCPFHDDDYWRMLQSESPQDFEAAALVDEQVRDMSRSGIVQPVFLHRSCVPLRVIDFAGEPTLWGDAWGNECSGHCGA